ncbi:MAG TPA: hypothetical protein VGG40_03070 [Solirubrobacterales bacterium]|jgi:hypothetical protein
MKKFLILGFAIAAMAVTGALTAASAAAAVGEFDSACKIDSECFFHADQKTESLTTFSGGVLKCTKATLDGKSTAAEGGTTVTTKGTSNHDWAIHVLKLHPEYADCTFIGQTANVTTAGCNYTITATSRTAGTITISCEVGSEIIVEAVTSKCTIKIPAQTPANNVVDFTKEETGGLRSILITTTVGTSPLGSGHTGLKYTSSGGACGASGENGFCRGTALEKAYSNEAHTSQVSGTIVETVSATEISE